MPAVAVPDNPIPIGGIADAIRELEEAAKRPPTPEEMAKDPKAQEDYAFEAVVVDAQGRKLGGKFKNRILTGDQRVDVGVLMAKMAKGVPWANLDEGTQFLIAQMAHLAFSLVEKPEGFSLGANKNLRLIDAVYREVTAHEVFFRGAETPA